MSGQNSAFRIFHDQGRFRLDAGFFAGHEEDIRRRLSVRRFFPTLDDRKKGGKAVSFQ